MENLHLIVGLGNPGAEYARTRHNAGFLVAERLAERCRAGWTYEKKFNARLASAQRNSRRVLLCEPQTYMNSTASPLEFMYVCGSHRSTRRLFRCVDAKRALNFFS